MTEPKKNLRDDFTDKDTGLTEKDEYFLSVLFGECQGDVPLAMDKSGINESPNSIRKRLKKEITEASKNYLAAASAEASINLVKVLRDPSAVGAKNIISAAKEIFDRGGVTTEQETKVAENYVFILPAKDTLKED